MLPMFYLKNWHVVGPAVTNFVLEGFRTRTFPANMNETLIALIPKRPSPEYASQCRPIALTNVVVKVITKVIANRLKGIIGMINFTDTICFHNVKPRTISLSHKS